MVIEDLLHYLVDTINPETTDIAILRSISKQCKRGTALTDRQYNLIKTKLLDYTEEFNSHGIVNVEAGCELTRLPLRSIDRSQYVKIVDHSEVYNNTPYESYKQNWKWIKVRFPFSKKNIVALEQVVNSGNLSRGKKEYYHEKGSHEHYFKLNEKNVYAVLDIFINKSFEIDPVLIEYYNEVNAVKSNKELHVISYKNSTDKIKELIDQELGTIDNLKLHDRRMRYGITSSYNANPGNLAGYIAFRNSIELAVNPDTWDLNTLAEAILKLDRFPILVLIDEEHALSQVASVYNTFSGIVPNERQSVLFRVDNNNNEYNLNNFVQDKSLNNWLDDNTEIVYINKNKLPKLLLTVSWKPLTVLSLSNNRHNTIMSTYLQDVSDLIIYYAAEIPLTRLYANGYM